MPSLMSILVSLHVVAATVWVGGMFFAYMALRPTAASLLEPPLRLSLWSGVFKRFFPWVWLAVILLLASGYAMIFMVFGGFASAGIHIHLMQVLGIIMMLIFMHLFFAPYKRLADYVIIEDWPAAALQLNQIRRMIGINLSLGLIVILIGSGGRYL